MTIIEIVRNDQSLVQTFKQTPPWAHIPQSNTPLCVNLPWAGVEQETGPDLIQSSAHTHMLWHICNIDEAIDFIFLLLCYNKYDDNHAFQARCNQKVPLLQTNKPTNNQPTTDPRAVRSVQQTTVSYAHPPVPCPSALLLILPMMQCWCRRYNRQTSSSQHALRLQYWNTATGGGAHYHNTGGFPHALVADNVHWGGAEVL